MSEVRWGIVGTGAIAVGFADALSQVDGATLAAVASRTVDGADAFGARFDVAARYASYEDLASDDSIDIAYIATPQSRHVDDTLLMVEAGKHVLCEKPFALDADESRSMVDAAKTKGVFLMEAMWSRFLPSYRHLVEVIGDGRIGEPILVEADFGWRREVDPEHRLFRRDLGGGGLLDLGIYPLQLASLVLGIPQSVAARGVIGETGVDELVAAVTEHPNGGIAVSKASLRVGMTCAARIAGTIGVIDIPALMHCPESITLSVLGEVERFDGSYEGSGMRFEIEEVHRCVVDGRTESAVMPLDESLALMRILDEIRAQIGLDFEG
jgi:predicted dehydrogenase